MRRLNLLATALGAGALLVSGAAFTMGLGRDGTFRVERTDLVAQVVAPGVVEPTHEAVALGFELSGRIEQMQVDEGDEVSAGQLLARLDDRLATARVARAEAALAAARARRDRATAGLRPAEVQAAEAAVEAARARAWQTEREHQRSARLAELDSIARSSADGAQSAAEGAAAELRLAEARLALAREGSRVEERREAAAAVQAAEAELEEARALLAQTELRAPRAGVILRRLAEPGEHVSTTPPRTIFTLADLSRLQLRVEVDEEDVGRVQVGQTGHARAQALGERALPGRVARLTRELGRKNLRLDDPRAKSDTRVLEALFVLESAEPLPLGLRMDVHLKTLARSQVLAVPLAALVSDGDETRVTVLIDGERRARKIELGARDGRMAEVRAGLEEGELVALSP